MSLALCTLAFWYGMAIRSWSSFKVLKNLEQSGTSEQDIREMLHFWTCFAVIALFDFYVEFFVSWLPLYPMVKLVLLWYVITPATKGSTVVFENFLAPKFQEKLFWLEKVFLVDILASFVELDWMYEQLTVQIGTRLESISREQLLVLEDRLQSLLDAIKDNLQNRRDTITYPQVPRLNSSGSDEGYEFIRQNDARRTPSPQEQQPVLRMEVDPRLIHSTGHTISLRHQLSPPVPAARKSPPPSNTIQPSYLPTRGITFLSSAYSPSPTRNHSPQNRDNLVQVPIEEAEEDVQDATLRSLEMDESPSPEPRNENDPQEGDSLLNISTATSPFDVLARRFSWMSPRWPSFSMASSPGRDDKVVDEDAKPNFPQEEEESFGPITRSKARQKSLLARMSSETSTSGQDEPRLRRRGSSKRG